SYWDDKFNGGFRRKNSIMEYFKNLTDAMNFYYINPNETSKKTISHLGKMKSDIACISFYDSVIIIEKYVKPKNQPFRNYFSGQKDLVVQKQDMINASCLKCDKNTKFEKFLK
ncbi:MAG: hypothetical protein FWH43_05845, partial [Endomicrobia bacterium]|nr:hypothetical protein [Endomicrobiia bacterium]